jgi:hypothetical protein
MKNATLILLICGASHIGLMAQETGKPEKTYKNTVRFNVTNPIIFGTKSIVFGYERVLNNRRSFSVNIGQANFPDFKIIDADSIRANSILGENGFHISGDYRFYLSKENKFQAPRGVYIGPYFAYNYFERKNSWTLISANGGSPKTAETKTSLSIASIGFEFGYQFIFWKRLSVDMILLGPGVAGYNLKASVGANLSEEDRQKLFDRLNQALADKFPGYTTVIDEGDFKRAGTAKTTTFGFRYMVMVGFRF